jgi:hypothetical protein
MQFHSILVIALLQITHTFAQICQATNNCISFTLSPGTGCAWMCNYCANNLGTNNYYFQPAICTYQSGVGCVGNPLAGVTYQCCSA